MKALHLTPHAGGEVDPVRDLGLPMRFMAVGLGVLALLALSYPSHLDLLRGSFYAPHLLTFVHVNTLGLIGAVIFGASYQMLPIVLQTPLASPRLARLSWWVYVAGLVSFIVGQGHGPGSAYALRATNYEWRVVSVERFSTRTAPPQLATRYSSLTTRH